MVEIGRGSRKGGEIFMRKKLATAFALAVVSAFTIGAPAFAHQAPCEETAGPGHSEYAKHHVVPLAKSGELGAGGHIPGEHHGYAGLCGVQSD
jgi:hypothetical protein